MLTLDKEKNPSFKVCDSKLWLAYKDGEIVGRIAGIIHKPFVEKWGNRYARFGWLDFINDEEVFDTLMQTVENWASDNGMEALQKARSFAPDIILLDVLLPDLDGISVCEILHRQGATRNTPIIMISAVSSEPTRSAAKYAGASAYLGKPLDFSALERALQKFLTNPCQCPQT